MRIKELLKKNIIKNLICLVLLVAVALLSIFVISKPATSPDTYKEIIESIDEKKSTVMGLTATAAAASTGLAMIPGDATTPIANQIMDISSYLMIVVCVLVLEKSLLTVMGYLSFNILIPIACVLIGVYLFFKKEILKTLAVKFVVFALVIVSIIPLSLKVSDLIYEMNKETIETVAVGVEENTAKENATEEKAWWEKAVDKVKDSTSKATENAKQILNKFIDAIAMFVITYCAIPVIVVLVVVWFLKFLFGITVPTTKFEKKEFFKKKEDKEEKLG